MKNICVSFSLILGMFILTVLNISCSKKDDPCVKKTWYRDADGDGKGDKASPYDACEQPVGYVANSDDDNDGVAQVV